MNKKIKEKSERKFNQGYTWAMENLNMRTITTQHLVIMYGSHNTIKNMNDYGMGVLRAVSDYRTLENMSAQAFDQIEANIK
jgi:uncharacterized protein YunC (DUF1805 family)